MKKRILIALVVLVALAALAFFTVAPAIVERRVNVVLRRERPFEASERARSLHSRLFVADLHADTLLWDRDLLERSARGHADVPRLVEGNVSLQFFTVVTKTPRGLNIERNDSESDVLTYLVAAERWPFAAWTSLRERALHQSRKLHRAASRSGGRLVVIRTASELARHLERRAAMDENAAAGEPLRGVAARAGTPAAASSSAETAGERSSSSSSSVVAALLGLEGAHALEGDAANLELLYEAGFRVVGLAHFFDNEWAGSAHGVEKGGLTGAGRELVARVEARGMIVDLAHASTRAFDDALAVSRRPVVVSHTGVRATCDNARNLTDDQLRRVAATGGVVGIGFWPTATCGTDARSIARAMRHAARVAGVEAVALGSDFDGAVAVPFDASGLVELTEALLAEGFTDEEIEKIMGGNVVRLLMATLPR